MATKVYYQHGAVVPDLQSLADYRCQPIPTWQPFILSVNLAAAQAAPEIRVVSNNTWCNTRRAQLAVTGIVGDAAELQSNTKLFRVESDNGPVLMALGPQRVTNPGGQLSFPDTEGGQGLFIIVCIMCGRSAWSVAVCLGVVPLVTLNELSHRCKLLLQLLH